MALSPADASTNGTSPDEERDRQRVLDLVTAAEVRLSEANMALRRARDVLDGILAASPPILAVEANEVVAWSEAMERLTGTPASDALGRRPAVVAPWSAGGAEHVRLADQRWWIRRRLAGAVEVCSLERLPEGP